MVIDRAHDSLAVCVRDVQSSGPAGSWRTTTDSGRGRTQA